MSRLNANCSFCIKNDSMTEIETEESITCSKCSFIRSKVFINDKEIDINKSISSKTEHFSTILINENIPNPIINEINTFYELNKNKIRGNTEIIYFYALVVENFFIKHNCNRTKEEIISMFRLDPKLANQKFFSLNKQISFKPYSKQNYSTILFRLFTQSNLKHITKKNVYKIFNFSSTIENNPFISNYKILICLSTIYVLKQNNVFDICYIKTLCRLLSINVKTICKYIKNNSLKKLIKYYHEIKQ